MLDVVAKIAVDPTAVVDFTCRKVVSVHESLQVLEALDVLWHYPVQQIEELAVTSQITCLSM